MKFAANLVKRKWGERVSAEWYGRWLQADDQPWRWVKLFTDRRASEVEWENFKREKEHLAAGVITPEMLAVKKPIAELRDEYLRALRQQGVTANHLRIAETMLDRIIEGCGWKTRGDINEQSFRDFLDERERAGDTAEYRRKWVSRGKAFANAVTPSGMVNPLARVRRPNTAKAEKRRGRRAATPEQIAALFDAAPECRRWAYLFPTLAGFRRGEQVKLAEGDLKLNAPIPFIQLRAEWTKNGKNDALPVHRALLPWLRDQLTGDPHRRIFPTLPDVRTMAKDLVSAGLATYTTDPAGAVRVRKGKYIKLADEKGRRLDFHALRHTFKNNLEESGASHTTCKRLMRHADGDVTDAYSHSRLSELAEAVNRLPCPATSATPPETHAQPARKTGTDSQKIAVYGTHMGHSRDTYSHFGAQIKLDPTVESSAPPALANALNPAICRAFHNLASTLLKLRASADTVGKVRPSTQVV